MRTLKCEKSCVFVFGEANKVCIRLTKGQHWMVFDPVKASDFYQCHRDNVTIEITKEDFNKIFNVQ